MVNPEVLLLAVLSADLTVAQTDVFIDQMVMERPVVVVALEHGISCQRVSQLTRSARRRLAATVEPAMRVAA